MLPLYPELPTTATAFWIGIIIALIHYAIRRRVVELFGTGFGMVVVGPVVQWWGRGITAAFGLYIDTQVASCPGVVALCCAPPHERGCLRCIELP